MADQPRKPCRACGERKPLSDYYRRTHSLDGHQGVCKLCSRVALDAATARRRALARTPSAGAGAALADDLDRAEALLAARASDVLGELLHCVDDGEPGVLTRLADLLCGDACPDDQADDEETHCLLHEIADLAARTPA
jgi:hypothetical protein